MSVEAIARSIRPVPGPASEAQASAHAAAGEAASGHFLDLSHSDGETRRDYKLYIPSSQGPGPSPLIVMLHGCKQNPDDFAAGTRMNELAEAEGFLVAYPAQSLRENCANCWNWFASEQQSRDGLEASHIAGIVRDITAQHAVDTSRIFVAGLSAGAAMAVILGATYPDLFAGVAAHSGLPIGAAHDVGSAFTAMRGWATPAGDDQLKLPLPTIVFHGDADRTVALSNGATIVEQALLGHAGAARALRRGRGLPGEINGIKFTRTGHADAQGTNRVEEWIVHGGTHAWFGGSSEGSYTDPAGPDASAEIVRFFLSQDVRTPLQPAAN